MQHLDKIARQYERYAFGSTCCACLLVCLLPSLNLHSISMHPILYLNCAWRGVSIAEWKSLVEVVAQANSRSFFPVGSAWGFQCQAFMTSNDIILLQKGYPWEKASKNKRNPKNKIARAFAPVIASMARKQALVIYEWTHELEFKQWKGLRNCIGETFAWIPSWMENLCQYTNGYLRSLAMPVGFVRMVRLCPCM